MLRPETDGRAREPRRVLLTGATGRIGSAFLRHARRRYRFRLAVHPSEDLGELGEYEVDVVDLANPEACRKVCVGMDAVVHLAADPSPQADFYGSLLDNNVRATYNVFEAARDAGCRRVVYASSLHVSEGYPLDVQVHPDAPPWPTNMYGVSKVFGEAVARYFASSYDIESVVVRVGSFDAPPFREKLDGRKLSTFVSPRDMSQLLIRCLETPDVQFAIAHGVSDNRFKRLDITSTRRIFGYEPQDDAFRVFEAELPRLLAPEEHGQEVPEPGYGETDNRLAEDRKWD